MNTFNSFDELAAGNKGKGNMASFKASIENMSSTKPITDLKRNGTYLFQCLHSGGLMYIHATFTGDRKINPDEDAVNIADFGSKAVKTFTSFEDATEWFDTIKEDINPLWQLTK